MYELDDASDEADHVMPWRQIITAAVFAVLAIAITSPLLAGAWLLGREPVKADGRPV